MNKLKVVIFCIRVDSTLVVFHQVMADVNEGWFVEYVAENTDFGVACNKPSEPVVCDANRWNLLPLTAPLEACFTEQSDLTSCHLSVRIRVWNREHFWVVKEHNSNATYDTLVNANRVKRIKLDMDVINVNNTCWVLF